MLQNLRSRQQPTANGYKVIVAMGGDGTNNEVLNGLMLAKEAEEGEAALGNLCIGTCNDFAYSVGIPRSLEEGCKALSRGRTRLIDVGHAIGFRYFGIGIGIGFDAVANLQAAQFTRKRSTFIYLVAVLYTIFFHYHAPITRIEGDDWSLEQPTLMTSVMNGQKIGCSFLVTPNAFPDDGLFDLCIGAKMNRLRMLSFVPRLIRGTHMDKSGIKMERSRKIRVTIKEGTQIIHADGETISTDADRLEIELLPRQLRVVC